MADIIETITIRADRRAEAEVALGKLVKKAHRYGNPDIAFTIGETYPQEHRIQDWDGHTRLVTIDFCDVTVSGEAPRHGDHEFLAHVEVGAVGNIVDVRPGHEIDARFRHTKGYCDHCKTDRQRKDVYILVDNTTGQQVQVGRTCLRDFLGIDDPASVAARFRFIRELGELRDEEHMGGQGWAASLEGILGLAATCIRLFGWCSKGQAAIDDTLTPTVSYVGLALAERASVSKFDQEDWDRIHQAACEDDRDVARTTIGWVRELAGTSDYEHNLTVLFQAEAVTDPKRLGLVVSAVAGYHRAQEKALRLTRDRQARAESKWVGQEGARVRGLLVTLDSQRSVGGNAFGDLVLIKLLDEEGNLLSWFTGRGTGHNPGTQFRLDGTVKRHTDYQGSKETQLTRCKLTPVEG